MVHRIQIGELGDQQLANLEFVAVTTQILVHKGQQSYVRNVQFHGDIPDGPAGVVLEDV
ncbi:Uncharacterized protein FKW44_005069 [Caligus rogercresseyi]|uniref:Uncharacterized protein n=1 Tax=Caligus rogercresseyi TaxID=217165 RepID=A0A7T8KBG1_CALRO|nr:Uncharacterized protein FKW44_005069 [Caligus rogercresseyi]